MINRDELIDQLTEKSELERDQVENKLKQLIEEIRHQTQEGESYEIEGFGTFYREHDTLQFEPSESLETELNYKYAGMEPVELAGSNKDLPDEELEEQQEGDSPDDELESGEKEDDYEEIFGLSSQKAMEEDEFDEEESVEERDVSEEEFTQPEEDDSEKITDEESETEEESDEEESEEPDDLEEEIDDIEKALMEELDTGEDEEIDDDEVEEVEETLDPFSEDAEDEEIDESPEDEEWDEEEEQRGPFATEEDEVEDLSETGEEEHLEDEMRSEAEKDEEDEVEPIPDEPETLEEDEESASPVPDEEQEDFDQIFEESEPEEEESEEELIFQDEDDETEETELEKEEREKTVTRRRRRSRLSSFFRRINQSFPVIPLLLVSISVFVLGFGFWLIVSPDLRSDMYEFTDSILSDEQQEQVERSGPVASGGEGTTNKPQKSVSGTSQPEKPEEEKPGESNTQTKKTEESSTSEQDESAGADADERKSDMYGLYGEWHSEGSSYALIIYSFTDRSNASEVINGMESKYRTYIHSAVVNGTKYFRVAVGQFKSVDAALEAAQKLDEKYRDNYFVRRISNS